MKKRSLPLSVGKHLVGLAVIAAVLVGSVMAYVSIRSISTARSTTQIAVNRTVNDGATHDMTIVWPTGQEQTLTYSETITPRASSYTGPRNTHQTVIDMFSFNPLDSANKAGERLTPSTFAEGDRPAITLNEDGVNASKAKGAEAVGEGGSNPVFGEYLGWVGIIIIGLIGLAVIAGIFKWLYNSVWVPLEPAVSDLASAAVASVIPVKVPVVAQTASAPAVAAAAPVDPVAAIKAERAAGITNG